MTDPVVMTVDFETRSYLNVIKVGSWRYAEEPTTEVMCMSHQLGIGEAKLWAPPMPFPQEVLDHIAANGIFEAHQAQFERAIWFHILTKGRYMSVAGIKSATPIPMPRRWRDSMAACAYRGIPMALDKAGAALALPIQKDSHGKYLIQTLCMPKWGTKKEPDRIYREDYDLMDELYDYCQQDARSEHKLSWALGPLPTPEYRIWVMDQIINQRGVQMDMDAVEGAIAISEYLEESANTELTAMTEGQVTAGTQRDKLLKWLQEHGLRITDLQKETVENHLDWLAAAVTSGETPAEDAAILIRALKIRQVSAKASAKKLYKMRETVCADGRIRGMLQYHGASTGRWAGRLVQPHNFPRGDMKVLGILSMEDLVDILRKPVAEALNDLEFLGLREKAMEAVSSSLRGMIIAKHGTHLMVADFAAIEARVVMWMAQEIKALEAFAAYDRGEGPDIYCVMAEALYGRPINKKDDPDERQLGKVTILGCGYQMGVDTFISQAEKDYKLFLSQEMGAKAVNGYRSTYPRVKGLWYGLNGAAIKAVQTGKPQQFSCVVYKLEKDNAGEWLSCLLPNGRKIWYYLPVIEEKMVVKPWELTKAKKEKRAPVPELQYNLSYMGRDNKRNGVWGRIRTYGGMLTENCVQAIARDLMVEGMIRVEEANYPIILTVHDEIISEVPLDHGSLEAFEALMAGPPPQWALDCPVAVEGWSGLRYKKA